MNKRFFAVILAIVMLIGAMYVGDAADSRKKAEAAYGTPTVDGEIDDIWESTNYYTVNNHPGSQSEFYKGWFKVMWDDNNIYVLAKYYGEFLNNTMGYPYYNDSIDIYVDEVREYQTGYKDDDYQIRSDFEGTVTGNNYKVDVKTGTKIIDEGFIMEMAFPLYKTKPEENLTIGFEVMMTAAAKLGIEMRTYNWNCTSNWLYNNTNCFGELILKKTVDVKEFTEPEYKEETVLRGYPNGPEPAPVCEKIDGVTTYFDGTPYQYPILHVDEYPSMAIEDLATVIGGITENGNTLKRDNVTLTYTEGNQLAVYNGGHLVLERVPIMYEGKLYVPLSSLLPTLCWTMEYNRFDKIIEICTGTNYSDTELVVYARDYGAVGDGVHDDGPAILEAVDTAVSSGVPSRVELDPDKSYLVGPRQDSQAFLQLEKVENFIFDGKGSELLIERATNSFLDIVNCTNVKITNLEVDYKELLYTQGRVTWMDADAMKFRMEIQEGYPLPAANDWVYNFFGDPGGKASLNGWSFGQIMDKTEDRLKFNNYDEVFILEVNHVQGREYELRVTPGYQANLREMEVGDRFVLNTRFSAYDVGKSGLDGLIHGMIRINGSGDITIENVNMYQAQWHAVNVGMCWGRIRLINFANKTKPGRLLCCNSDGVHYWRNRWGVVMDGVTMENNLDDQLNAYGSNAFVRNIVSENESDGYVYDLDLDLVLKVGDELIFTDKKDKVILGRAFVKDFKWTGGYLRVTTDRKVEGINAGPAGVATTTKVHNNDGGSKASVVRNCVFKNSRRNAWLVQSQNSIFENNEVYNCGGSAVHVAGEVFVRASAGPYPNYFTIRNNYMEFEGQIQSNGPIYVHCYDNTMGDTPKISGVLIENNHINAFQKNCQINIHSVNGLWLFNNIIECDKEVAVTHMPVVIMNSRIEQIDGIKIDYTTNVNAAVTIAGCLVDEANIKNIEVLSGNTAKPYVIK